MKGDYRGGKINVANTMSTLTASVREILPWFIITIVPLIFLIVWSTYIYTAGMIEKLVADSKSKLSLEMAYSFTLISSILVCSPRIKPSMESICINIPVILLTIAIFGISPLGYVAYVFQVSLIGVLVMLYRLITFPHLEFFFIRLFYSWSIFFTALAWAYSIWLFCGTVTMIVVLFILLLTSG